VNPGDQAHTREVSAADATKHGLQIAATHVRTGRHAARES